MEYYSYEDLHRVKSSNTIAFPNVSISTTIGVKTVEAISDGTSNVSTVVAVAGVALAPFTSGSSLAVVGPALAVSTTADGVSLSAKTVDALAFNGSWGDVGEQSVKFALSATSGYVTKPLQ